MGNMVISCETTRCSSGARAIEPTGDGSKTRLDEETARAAHLLIEQKQRRLTELERAVSELRKPLQN